MCVCVRARVCVCIGLDDEPWRRGDDGEAVEEADKKGVAWLKRARTGTKATSKATSKAQVAKLVGKKKKLGR